MPEHRKRNSLQSSGVGQQRSTSPEICGVSPDESDPNVEPILYLYDFRYILGQVKRAARLYAQIAHPDVLDLELEDIAQEVHIHFWQKLEVAPVEKPRAYIRQMIFNAFVDVVRRRKAHGAPAPLPETEDGELCEDKLLTNPGETMSDPETELEQKEAVIHRADEVAVAISALPPRQKNSMECSLHERLDNLILFVDTFKLHGLNIEAASWPAEHNEKRLLKASISAARSNIARALNIDLAHFKRKGASYF